MSTATMFAKPSLGPQNHKCRPYQSEAIEAVRMEFRKRKSTRIVHATGLGKTFCASAITRLTVENKGRVLFLVHRERLVRQAANAMAAAGLTVGVEKAQEHGRSIFVPDVVVGSVQTMRGKRLESWPKDYFKLLIVDECHHSCSPSYRKILEYFESAYRLGITATDNPRLNKVFETIAHKMTLKQGILAPHPGPYLAPISVVQCPIDIDLRGIKTQAGDFTVQDLVKRITPQITMLANAIRKEVGQRKTVVFTPDVNSAMAMATALQSLEEESPIGMVADFIYGEDPLREEKEERFQYGDLQVVCNCALWTEGVDFPEISAIVNARPTKSIDLYKQIVGRGTRPFPGKTDCLLIDFNYVMAEERGLCTPADLFDEDDPDVRRASSGMFRRSAGKKVSLLDAIEEAKIEVEQDKEKKKRELVQINAQRVDVKYRKIVYDPLSNGNIPQATPKSKPAECDLFANVGQVLRLESFGVRKPESYSFDRAKALITELERRKAAGLASYKQCRLLSQNGVEHSRLHVMTKGEAGQIIDDLSRKWVKRE